MQFHYSWRDKQTQMIFSPRVSYVQVSLCMITIHYPCNWKAVTKSAVFCLVIILYLIQRLAHSVWLIWWYLLLPWLHLVVSLWSAYHFFITKWKCSSDLFQENCSPLASVFRPSLHTAAVIHSLVLCHYCTNKQNWL